MRSRIVRALSGVLVALELVVAVSALQRLRLYEQQYGLTELRIWTTGVVLWLMCVFVWLSLTTLRGRGRFAVGALVLGFAATAALNVLSPDALIARTNLSRPHVDTAYLARLSDDAVPTLVSRLPSLRPDLRADLARRLLARSEARRRRARLERLPKPRASRATRHIALSSAASLDLKTHNPEVAD